MEGGMTCVKYTMFIFNLLIFLAGAALLGVGIWAAVSANAFSGVITSQGLIYGIIVVGAVVFLIGFLGCCGAVNENKCLLGSFFTLVLILFILQIVFAILLIVYKPKAEKLIEDSLTNARSGNATDMATWDVLQDAVGCCGYNGPKDWQTKIPSSCYPGKNTTRSPYPNGCKSQFGALFWVVAGIALGILLIELLAMIFACCMIRTISETKEYA